MQTSSLPRLLSWSALVAAVGGVGTWVVTGARWGFTQTQVAETQIDPVTELPYPVYRDVFHPGIEFPAVGLALGVLFFGLAVYLRRRAASSS